MPNTQLLVKVEHLYSGKKYEGKQTSKERGTGSLSSGASTANHSCRLMLLSCYVTSPRVSTDNFACWLVLVCCNLLSLSLEFPAACLSLIQGAMNNSLCCHNSHCFNSVPFKAKMSCKHGYIGHASMLYLL